MLKLSIEYDGKKELVFEVRKLLNLGRTAREQSEIEKHTEELRKEGIAITVKKGPVFTPKLPDRITTSDKIEVLSNMTSGESEYVLLLDQDAIYVTVGSDHTDREHEKYSVLVAKQLCPNVIAQKVWRYEDVKDHWDDLILRGWVEKEGQWQLYQETKLAKMMRPEELIKLVKSHVKGDMTGMVIYSGTFPIIGGEICFSPRFKAELVDESLGKTLACEYTVEPMSWFE